MQIPSWLVKVSIIANTLTCGPKHMSLCARFYVRKEQGWKWANILCATIDKVFFFDPHHCFNAHRMWVLTRSGVRK